MQHVYNKIGQSYTLIFSNISATLLQQTFVESRVQFINTFVSVDLQNYEVSEKFG